MSLPRPSPWSCSAGVWVRARSMKPKPWFEVRAPDLETLPRGSCTADVWLISRTPCEPSAEPSH